jgi:hypothetical protein
MQGVGSTLTADVGAHPQEPAVSIAEGVATRNDPPVDPHFKRPTGVELTPPYARPASSIVNHPDISGQLPVRAQSTE